MATVTREWRRLLLDPELTPAQFLRRVADDLRSAGFTRATLDADGTSALVARAVAEDGLVVAGDIAVLPLRCADLAAEALVLEWPGLAQALSLVAALQQFECHLGLALRALDSAAAARAHAATYTRLFDHMRNGVAHCRAVFDGDRCVDWVFLRVNQAFGRQTGMRDVIGRRLSEVVPQVRALDPTLFERYGAVVRTGESVTFERHVAALDAWFEVAAYRAGPGEFIAVFDVITERKRAEVRLRASERRFRSIFDHAAVGVALMGTRGEFRHANRWLCQHLGYSEAELQRMTYMDVTHDDHAASDQALHEQMAVGDLGTMVIEKQLVRKDGVPVWHRVTIARADADPDELTFVAITEDITAQRQAEQRRAESEHRLRLFVDHAPAAIAMFDRDMRYLAASKRYATDFRLAEDDLVGRLHSELFSDVPRHWRAHAIRCLSGSVERSDGEPFPRADGEVDWVRWELRPWRDASGAIGGCVLFSEFLTEQRRLALALATSEARQHAIFAQTGVGMALVEMPSARFLEVNEAMCATLGHPRASLLQMSWHEVTLPEDLATTPAQIYDGQPRAVTFHKRYLRGDGATIWGRVTVTRIEQGDGPWHNAVMLEDVTDQRRAEDALRESERRLQVVFQQSLAGMGVVRKRDQQLIDVSDSLARMLGWTRDELLGRSYADLDFFVEPSDLQRLQQSSPSAAAPIEVRGRRKDGDVGSFLVSVSAIEINGEPCSLGLLHDITALRRADAALRDSERHLHTVIDLAPIGIAEGDLEDGRMRRVNARLCELTGYSADELRALDTIDELTHPDDRAASRAVAARLRAGEPGRVRLEKRYLRRDGQPVWVDVTISTVRDQAGAVTGTLSSVEDITERRQAQAALELQTQALDAAANAIVITDRRGQIESFNPAFVELTGYSADELRGASMRLLQSGHQPPEFYRAMWQTVLDGHVWRGELVNRRRDGSLYHEDMTVTPLRDERGEVTRFVAIKQDVSERYRAEAALRISEARYRTLVDDLEDVVFTTDGAGQVTFVNRAIAALGYAPDELIGRSFATLVHPADQAGWDQLLTSSGAPPPRELRLVDGERKLRTVRVRVRPRQADAPQLGVAGVLVDLTARRETEEQLRAAQKMEAVGRLAGGVAHDFNNLLSVILSYTDLAVGDLHAEDPLRADLQEVLAAAHRAEGLTRQLLAFSRKQVLNPEPTDLAELVTGLAKMLRRLIGEDVELVLAGRGSAALVTVDRGQIEQVLMNLVVNARDAMPDGGRVTITTDEVELDDAAAHALDLPPGRYLEIDVADTGCGMDEAVRARVFEPFFTTKGVGKGTGLGLSMVYGIVRQSGGAVAVDSRPGHGATFRVYLPGRDPAAPTIAARLAAPRLDRGDETVLVVEDEAALRSVVQRVLATSGYDVLVAANATEALLLAERHGPRVRLILTDVIMPAMGGRELVQRLVPHCPEAAVIFMSGYTDEAIERFGILDADFLRKPFDLRVLTERVRAALDQHRPG